MEITLQDINESNEMMEQQLSLWSVMSRKLKGDFLMDIRELLAKTHRLAKSESDAELVSYLQKTIEFWSKFLLDIENYRIESVVVSPSKKTSNLSRHSNTQSGPPAREQTLRYLLPQNLIDRYVEEVAKLSESITTKNKVSRSKSKSTIPKDPRLIALYKKLSQK